MPLPTPIYTWQFDVNQLIPYYLNDYDYNEHIMLAIKTSLISFASSPWTVIASCNKTTVGLSDLWNTTADLTWTSGGPVTTNTRSWILLRQTGISANFEMVIDLLNQYGGAQQQATFWLCPDGFDTSSIATNQPPTPNSSRYIYRFDVTYSDGVDQHGPGRLHVMQSTDGADTRWTYCRTGSIQAFMGISKVVGANMWTPGWSDPFVLIGPASPTYASYTDSANVRGYLEGSWNAEFSMNMTTEFFGHNALGQMITSPDSGTGEWPITPIGLACFTSGIRGPRRATLPDLWFGSTARNTGDTYPLSPATTREFAQFGDMIVPWNGTTVRTY